MTLTIEGMAVDSRTTKGRVLVVDDDQRLLDALAVYLEREGYTVAKAQDGVQGLEVFDTFQPDLVILDVMMPRMNGWDACRTLREKSTVPIIMLTARGQENERVMGLRLGADDYVSKPFSLKELEARVEAILRRVRMTQSAASGPLYQDEYLTIDASGWEVTRQDKPVDLTATERKLLFLLVEHINEVLSADTILDRVWGRQYADRAEYVKLYIWRLRQKLEQDATDPRYIVTERGRGYRFAPAPGAKARP